MHPYPAVHALLGMHVDAAVWLCTDCNAHGKEPTPDATHTKHKAPVRTEQHHTLYRAQTVGPCQLCQPTHTAERWGLQNPTKPQGNAHMHTNTSHRAFEQHTPPNKSPQALSEGQHMAHAVAGTAVTAVLTLCCWQKYNSTSFCPTTATLLLLMQHV